MFPKPYRQDELIGMKCYHGSPGYENLEQIKKIVPFEGTPLKGIGSQKVWEIHFESGSFTVVSDYTLQMILWGGFHSYGRVGGFTVLESICLEEVWGAYQHLSGFNV